MERNAVRQWEQMHRIFNTDRKGKTNPRTAANTLIAWPVFLQIIRDGVMDSSRILDYGCGNGRFCRYMRSAGLKVDGVDISPVMIETAMKNSSRQIRYHVEEQDAMEQIRGKFNAITAFMVFEFIKDIESRIQMLSDLLAERGLLVFSVHNPDFVRNCISSNVGFHPLRQVGRNTVTSMEIEKGVSIDMYMRPKEQYREIFEKHGFEYMSTRYPQFTPEFVAEHGWTLPSDDSEYLIMSLRKKH